MEGTLSDFGETVREEKWRVREFISADNRWDEEKVRESFSSLVQEYILGTPICELGAKDERMWRFDDKGKFSVKSAYLVEIGFYAPNASSSDPDKKRWSKLGWNVSIPPKARVFLWRAYNDLIPTPANLQSHHVPSSGICCLCGDRWGSTEHCLLFCPAVVSIWKFSRFKDVLRKASGLALVDIAAAVRAELGVAEYELWAVLLWEVWSKVCRLLHPQPGPIDLVSEESCLARLEAFQEAAPVVAREAGLGVVLGDKQWVRPSFGRLRVDVEAHFNPAAREFGVGVVVRNHNGNLVAALAKPASPSSNPVLAEVMAVVQGLVLCVDKELVGVELFTDSFLVARVMANKEEEKEFLPDDICDILRVARESFLLGIFHMYRSVNGVAHDLARRAARSSRPLCWVGSFPTWLRELVLADIS